MIITGANRPNSIFLYTYIEIYLHEYNKVQELHQSLTTSKKQSIVLRVQNYHVSNI